MRGNLSKFLTKVSPNQKSVGEVVTIKDGEFKVELLPSERRLFFQQMLVLTSGARQESKAQEQPGSAN